jgi:hypothetical protein
MKNILCKCVEKGEGLGGGCISRSVSFIPASVVNLTNWSNVCDMVSPYNAVLVLLAVIVVV